MLFAWLREATPHSGHGSSGHFLISLGGPAGLQGVFQKVTALPFRLCVTSQPLSTEAIEMLLEGCVQAAVMSPLCPWLGGER